MSNDTKGNPKGRPNTGKFKFRTFVRKLKDKLSCTVRTYTIYDSRKGGFTREGKLVYPILAHGSGGECDLLAHELVALIEHPTRLQYVYSYITNNYIEKDLLRGTSKSDTMLIKKSTANEAFKVIQFSYRDIAEWNTIEEQEKDGGFPRSYYLLKEELENVT